MDRGVTAGIFAVDFDTAGIVDGDFVSFGIFAVDFVSSVIVAVDFVFSEMVHDNFIFGWSFPFLAWVTGFVDDITDLEINGKVIWRLFFGVGIIWSAVSVIIAGDSGGGSFVAKV